MQLIYGVGIKDIKVPYRDAAYSRWSAMLRRCYCQHLWEGVKHQTYEGCTVHEDWKYLSNFREWAHSEPGFRHPHSCLDKDILVFGNKMYSPDAATFVPREINIALTFSNAKRGKYPLGVYLHKIRSTGPVYKASVNRGDLGRIFKEFRDVDQAAEYYRVEKVKHLSYLADKYREWLRQDVYETLKDFDLRVT